MNQYARCMVTVSKVQILFNFGSETPGFTKLLSLEEKTLLTKCLIFMWNIKTFQTVLTVKLVSAFEGVTVASFVSI